VTNSAVEQDNDLRAILDTVLVGLAVIVVKANSAQCWRAAASPKPALDWGLA
jgi:hypothetical protein